MSVPESYAYIKLNFRNLQIDTVFCSNLKIIGISIGEDFIYLISEPRYKILVAFLDDEDYEETNRILQLYGNEQIEYLNRHLQFILRNEDYFMYLPNPNYY